MSEVADGSGSPTPRAAHRGHRRLLEIGTVLLLSLSALFTAWCGYEASMWGGDTSVAFSEASGARIQATAAQARALDARQYDLAIYIEWMRATVDHDQGLAHYIKARFSPELQVAFDAWEASGRRARSPLSTVQYVPPGTADAAEFSAVADARFADALSASGRSGHYSLLTVLFALVLFLAALSQRDIPLWARTSYLSFAIAVALVGITIAATFPIRM
ncbi:MAG TPA: hypothetical protein PKE32_07805 [Miltoncostaeaceae bacterium]|nr:hypothetical protein [Miltoncostaeaceae bacterium]